MFKVLELGVITLTLDIPRLHLEVAIFSERGKNAYNLVNSCCGARETSRSHSSCASATVGAHTIAVTMCNIKLGEDS